MVSLGIIFYIVIITLNPMAFADSNFTIYIENENNCTNNSCISEEGLIVKQNTTITGINNESMFHSIYREFQHSGKNAEFESSRILPGKVFQLNLRKTSIIITTATHIHG